jgi:hypothetical protein
MHDARPKRLRFLVLNTVGKVVRHARETLLRCNRCDRPMCTECAVQHPVGLRCKECIKELARVNYRKSPAERRAYEQKRQQDPARRLKKLEYQATHRAKNALKSIARIRLTTAVKFGRVIKQPCEVCGEKKSEAHHPDYTKPLDVVWLCLPHHRERDRQEREQRSLACSEQPEQLRDDADRSSPGSVQSISGSGG